MATAQRNSSIELLRIFAILGVFILHFNNPNFGGGLTYAPKTNEALLRVLTSLFVCSVNVFVLISGYFLSASTKRNFGKPIELLFKIIGSSLLIYGVALLTKQDDFSIKSIVGCFIPRNWFVFLYIALYIISPYLNIIIDKLSKEQYWRFLVILFAVFSVYPFLVDVAHQLTGYSFSSTVGLYGSHYGYSIVNFILLYFLGGGVHKNLFQLSERQNIIALCGTVLILTMWSYLDKFTGYEVEPNAWEYINPLVIIEALLVFMLFNRKKTHNKIINKLSSACFAMYLLHPIAINNLDIRSIVSNSPFIVLGLMILCATGTFVLCFLVDFLWAITVGKVFRNINIGYYSEK